MAGLLEVVALHAADAERAAEGGADRIELRGSVTDGGMSPEPSLVSAVRRAARIPIRVLVRLRAGFSTDGGELTRLKGLISAYRDLGAEGMVFGFLNAHSEVDRDVCNALLAEGDWPWTFHRAFDSALDAGLAWRSVTALPRLDQVLTGGAARGLPYGLDELLARIRLHPEIARYVLAGGGLAPEHVPWLARAGVRSFHIGRPARPQGSYKAYVDAALVHSWRTLIDSEIAHHTPRTP